MWANSILGAHGTIGKCKMTALSLIISHLAMTSTQHRTSSNTAPTSSSSSCFQPAINRFRKKLITISNVRYQHILAYNVWKDKTATSSPTEQVPWRSTLVSSQNFCGVVVLTWEPSHLPTTVRKRKHPKISPKDYTHPIYGDAKRVVETGGTQTQA